MSNHQSSIANHQSSWRWWVCGALLLATLLNYMDRQALSETATELKERYNLDDARYGQVERWFSYAFAVGSILFGFLADRFGPRRLYPVVLVGWSLAGIATTLRRARPDVTAWLETPGDEPGTGTFRWLLICRTVLGLFEAGHWPCALHHRPADPDRGGPAVRQRHPPERRERRGGPHPAVRAARPVARRRVGGRVLDDRAGRAVVGAAVVRARPPRRPRPPAPRRPRTAPAATAATAGRFVRRFVVLAVIVTVPRA